MAQPAERPVNTYDGPTLRAVREHVGIPLRRIARTAGMSHGHLSKVERGEHGRPVTPAVVAAYERVTGVKLADAVAQAADRAERQTGRPGTSWTPGQLTDLRRRGFNAAIAALTVGGHLGEPVGRLIDSASRPVTPTPPEPPDVVQLEQLTELLTSLDLRHGGGLVSQVSKTVLRWAAPMLDATGISEPASQRLHAALGALAHRAAWAAYDTSAHEAARSLFRLALAAAVRAGDHNLRAHLLADVAAQHNQLGYHQDALDLVRLGEGDERVAPAVRMPLHGVRARTYAAIGEADACRQQVEAADQCQARALPDTGDPAASTGQDWVGTVGTPGRLMAVTGHALAELAGHTGKAEHRDEAVLRLTTAIDELDRVSHARAHTFCTGRLALLHLTGDDRELATRWEDRAQQTLLDAEDIHSSRLHHDLAALRAVAPPPPTVDLGHVVGNISDIGC